MTGPPGGAGVLVEEVEAGITAVRLNRPERLNAIDFGLVAALHDALDRVAADDRCKVVILTGRTVDAAEAERMGLVSRVVPDERLWDEALETARAVAGFTSYGLRNTKEVMWLNLDTDNMAAAIALENRNQELGSHSEEVRAYMAAYSERHRRERRGGGDS